MRTGWAVLVIASAACGAVERYEHSLGDLPPRWRVAGDWAVTSGAWTATPTGLEASGDEARALLTAMPRLATGTARVTVTPLRRAAQGGWAFAGVLLSERSDRFWQLALVEDPQGEKRYFELVEQYDATWQAQSSGGTRLEGRRTGADTWEYGRRYELQLTWDAQRVTAQAREAGRPEWQWQSSYDLPAAVAAVRTGRWQLCTRGLGARFADVALSGQPVAGRVTGPRAVLLDGPGPWQTPAWTATAEAFERLLKEAGYVVRKVPPAMLEGTLDPADDGLLAVPSLELLPLATAQRLAAFVADGGDLLASGGEPFREVLYPRGDGWAIRREILQSVTDRRIVLAPATARGLRRSSNRPEPAPVLTYGVKGPTGEVDALAVEVPLLSGWEVLGTPPFERAPFGPGETLTIVSVRGTPGQAITVEWKEADNSRWIAQVPLRSQWTTHLLEPHDFVFWRDGSPPQRAETSFVPANARALSFGPAVGQGATRIRSLEYAIGPVATAASPLTGAPWLPPTIATVSPWYQQYDVTRGGQEVREPVARPRGLVTSAETEGRYTVVGELLAPAASRMVTTDGAAICWLPSAKVPEPQQKPTVELLRRTRLGVHLLSGGAPSLVVTPSSAVDLGARVLNTTASAAEVTVTWRVVQNGRPLREARASCTVPAGGSRGLAASEPAALAAGDYQLVVELRTARAGEGVILDQLSSLVRVMPAAAGDASRRVSVKDGRFVVGGKRLFLHGVNYWPRCVSGLERGRYWRHWLSPERYDPDVVEADLTQIQALGWNLVSIMYGAPDQAGPLRDFLDRCRRHGLWANVFLAGAHPLDFRPQQVARLIEAAGLAGNDTVFAYDLAWEPRLGRHRDREAFDARWRAWLAEQYGDLAAAEAAWGVAAPRTADGQVTNPLDAHIERDGEHRAMVAAYRRFADDLISRGYRRVVQHLRQVSPGTLLGARTGYGGTGQPGANGVFAYDLVSGAAWLDFTSPEGYGLPPSFAEGRQTGLVSAYARWAGNGKPVFWCEFGSSLGPRGGTEQTQRDQERIWETMLRVVNDSDADAAAGWWWPGGWRLDEQSDYGVLSPDGSVRPAARAAAEIGKAVQQKGNDAGTGDPVRIRIDRDADARALSGLWARHGEAYLAARRTGRPVRLETAASGTDTASLPRTQVGGAPYRGTGPLAGANAEIAELRLTWPGGGATVDNGGSVQPPAGQPVELTVVLLNSGEAAWLPAGGPGGCELKVGTDRVGLRQRVERYQTVAVGPFRLPPAGREQTLTGRLTIAGLGGCGEPLRLTTVGTGP